MATYIPLLDEWILDDGRMVPAVALENGGGALHGGYVVADMANHYHHYNPYNTQLQQAQLQQQNIAQPYQPSPPMPVAANPKMDAGDPVLWLRRRIEETCWKAH